MALTWGYWVKRNMPDKAWWFSGRPRLLRQQLSRRSWAARPAWYQLMAQILPLSLQICEVWCVSACKVGGGRRNAHVDAAGVPAGNAPAGSGVDKEEIGAGLLDPGALAVHAVPGDVVEVLGIAGGEDAALDGAVDVSHDDGILGLIITRVNVGL